MGVVSLEVVQTKTVPGTSVLNTSRMVEPKYGRWPDQIQNNSLEDGGAAAPVSVESLVAVGLGILSSYLGVKGC